MQRAQRAEPGHQPVRGEQRQDREPQPHQLAMAGGALHRLAELLQRRPDLRQQLRALMVEQHRLVAPLEQGLADEPLQRLHPARQSGRGQSKGFGRGLDRAEPGGLDESLHGCERRQPFHPAYPRETGLFCAAHIMPSVRMRRFSALF